MDERELLSIYKRVYDYIDERNIYDVRGIARAFGVSAPCEKRKHELIVQLIGIVAGVTDPGPRTNKGARVKAGAASEEDLAQIRRLIEECRAEAPYSFPSAAEPVRIEFHDSEPSEREFGYADVCSTGILEVMPQGHGFLRSLGCEAGENDPVLSEKTVRSYYLRSGDIVSGYLNGEDAKREIVRVAAVNGKPPLFLERKKFDEPAPLFPEERLNLGEEDAVLRAVDLLCPVGKGQRAAIYAESGTGKTEFIRRAARSVAKSGAANLIFVLLNQRPEEIAETRSAFPNATVAAAPFDAPLFRGAQIASLALERAKRIAENGEDALLFLDSLTWLERSFAAGSAGSGAPVAAKKYFASARRLEGGGTLTIIATVLVGQGGEEGSYGDAANAEMYFSRGLAMRGVIPAVDFSRSYTKRSDRLLNEEERSLAADLRSAAAEGGTQAVLKAMETAQPRR